MVIMVAMDLIGIFTGFGILITLALIPCFYALYRTFSRNISARQAENYKFLSWWNRVKGWFSRTKDRAVQSKDYKFYACPNCGQEVRVPRGKGKIRITCPKCGNKFEKKT